MRDYLITEEEKTLREKEKDTDGNAAEEVVFIVNEILKRGLRFWDGFKTYLNQKGSKEFDYYITFDLLKKLKENKNLSSREIAFGKKVLDFVDATPDIVDEIKALSNLPETEIVEVKFIYDKLHLLSKEDWQRAIDLATQTNIFDNLELANVKSVRSSLLKKDKNIKEQSTFQAYTSLLKLKKFGIQI